MFELQHAGLSPRFGGVSPNITGVIRELKARTYASTSSA